MSVSNNGTVETDISQSDPEDDIPHPSTKKVLDPDDPRMAVFQYSLKQMLLKQKDDIQTELLNMEKKIKNKKMIHESVEQERNIITDRLRAQHDTLKKFRSTEKDLQTMKRKTENSINEVKQQFNEITKKTSKEMKKISVLKRKLGYSQNLLKDLTIYEEEQAINFKKFDSKKSQAKQLKKMHLNNQQKKDLLSSSLTQEVERLEDRMKQLIKESEAKYNESELLKQKVIDSSTNLDTINRDNVKLTLLWDTVLSRINQRHESIQRMKIESQEANEKYRTLLREVDSYKRSLEKESLRKDDLCKSANQLEQKKMNLQNSYDTVLIEFNNSKDEYSQLIQITEFEHLNLNQVLMDQKTLDNEIQMLINLLAIKSNLKLKYEEDVLNEFKVLSNTSKNNSNHLKTIDELTIKNTEHERTLADFEETFKQYKLELEQKRGTSTNLKNDILKSTQCLNEQELVISTLHSELKKLDIQWRDANDSILYKNTTLKSENNNEKKNLMLVIDQVQHKIDDAQKETEFIKQSWVKNQNQNVQLIIKRNKQVNELNTVHENALILDSKNKNLKMEIISLSKQLDQHERTINNMKRKINTLNENVYKKEGKNSQLLNETEWFQNASIAEMKENEKQCLEKILQLKLVKNELNELKIASTKKQCEFSSLDSKVQAIVKLKKIMKSKDGDNADIEIKKQYIHKMQRREDQLNKTVKQLMTALENTLKTHANIYEKAKSKPVNSKRINDEKKTFLKKLDNLRTVIKKKEIECRNLDKSLNCSQHDKIELETEITSLNDKITHIQKEINDLTANIEDSGVTKIKNGYKHTNLHSYVKSLEEVNNDKHSLLVKDETKTNDELAAQLKITSDLTSVVEALKNDFPDLDNEIKRILCFFKSAMEIHLENNE